VEESLGEPKSENLAQLYKVKGALLEFLGNPLEATGQFAKAV